MPPTKRRRLSQQASDEASDIASLEAVDPDDEQVGHSDFEGEDVSDAESLATDAEIADAQRPVKSKKTQKRKRRATSPSQFGATLQSLLNTSAPTNLPLSLKPSVAKHRTDEILEGKAKKLLEGERKDKEEKNHIRDVIGGWGGESERSLRKVAQRGVVKLFNAIQQTQIATAAVQEEAKAARGSGKPTLPAPVLDSKVKRKKTATSASALEKSESTLNQDAFLRMIKSGGIVSKSNAQTGPKRPKGLNSPAPSLSALMPTNSQKITVRPEEWDKRLHEVQVTKNDLNRLIMDYLVIEGYKSAAEEFSKEADLATPIDFQSIEDRTNIREALQRGDVEEAITRVNDLNPEILDTNPTLYFRLQQQKLIEYIRQGRIPEALQFAQQELAPRGEESPEFLLELERTMALLAFESTPMVPAAIAELLSPAQAVENGRRAERGYFGKL
ncbi:CTLH/CRA C-terminal to lish motif domain-containing protein [Phellopilus nigrolimitatus]|nr:CTLH/CRA C-terminal to lish motif domain-containing protein [Phellopilus nigrolimitatus]